MSALSLMCRTAILVLALVALTACGAYAAQDSATAKVHRKTTAGAHAARRATPARNRQQAVAAETRKNHQASTSRKPTPGEAGRTAGLAIRRRLAQKRTARRLVALPSEHARAASGTQGKHSLHSQKRTGETSAMEVASTAPVLLLPNLAEETERPRASARGTSRAASHAPANIRDHGARRDNTQNGGAENEVSNKGIDPAEREASRKNSPWADKALAARDEAAGAGMNRIVPPELLAPGKGAEAPSVDTETEAASLRVPRDAMPAPLLGSHESLERQNARVDADGLERIENEADLADRIAHKLLVPIPASSALTVNPDLEENHRYCRPWTAKFLADLARAHDAAFHRSIEVSSAVRTVEYQKRLMRTNGNAAPAEGDMVSPHLTGATVDIAKKGLSRAEIAWMRRRLMGLEASGKIDVEEEFKQACFHITVYKSYSPAGKAEPVTPAKPVADRPRRLKAEPVEAQGA